MVKNCSTCLNLQFGTKENNQQNKFVLKCKFGKMLNPFLQFYSCKNYKRKPFRTYDGIETLFSIKSKFYKSVPKENDHCHGGKCAFYDKNCYGYCLSPCVRLFRKDGKNVYFVEVKVKRKDSKKLEMSTDGNEWFLYDREKDEYYELNDPELEITEVSND